ncbi:MAG TPA: VOC family protein [Bacillota bacterium]|nr:VOC family protein [Bacillota bacterium]
MAIDIYINFNGNCREAVEFYVEVFGTEKPQFMTFGDAPPNPESKLPEEAKQLIMHTQLKINGGNVMFSDTFPGMPFVSGNNISLVIASKNLDKMKSYFAKLKVDGTVQMDLQETFWSKCYGYLTDKFGIGWQFNYDSNE